MSHTANNSWKMARTEPFEAFGILYYPLFRSHDDLSDLALDDEDMAWAVTANANLEGTGYTLSQQSMLTLAAYHHKMAELARNATFLPLASATEGINPLADLIRLVPSVTATPMYPDFPSQVMEISEAEFRYHQAMHYASTYGVELVAGLLGLDVTVSEGWIPDAESTPKDQADETLLAPKVLHVLLTVEDLRSVVCARLARATRMHPAEIATTMLVFSELGTDEEASFPAVAFHENMMELIRVAAKEDSQTLERVAAGLSQHPGDLLKAVFHVVEHSGTGHLTTRQKKGFCQAFEHFETMSIARNIADAGRHNRLAPNYLSVARFGGPRLREAIQLVESHTVRSWVSELEIRWDKVRKAAPSDRHEAWESLLEQYGYRPGMLLRSMARLVKGGCPPDLLAAATAAHADSFSLPTLVSTLTAFSSQGVSEVDPLRGTVVTASNRGKASKASQPLDESSRKMLCSVFAALVEHRLRTIETPLRGKRVFLDTAGISLVGSVLRPNETGNTATAWPPVGIAFDLPKDKTVRFFTFWDDRKRRVDIDLHFVGKDLNGGAIHIGWNSSFRSYGMVTSGDVTTSVNSVEYLDMDMDEALRCGVHYVVQQQHIYSGRSKWGDIQTCYSGALLVSSKRKNVALYNAENLLFRDDLKGSGRNMSYAVINVPNHYVRILRGASLPLTDVDFSLGDYLNMLFRAQEVTLVDTPDEADLLVCVGRSDNPEVISLFDEGFYIG